MGKAAKITIAEVEEIVEIGELDPNFIHLPGNNKFKSLYHWNVDLRAIQI